LSRKKKTIKFIFPNQGFKKQSFRKNAATKPYRKPSLPFFAVLYSEKENQAETPLQ
jgi:hypothetical protein